MRTKVSRKSSSKEPWSEDVVKRFTDFFGFEPSGQGMMRQMEQARINDKIGRLNDESGKCIEEMRRIIQPYADANNSETWESPRLIRFHFLQAKVLDDELDRLGHQIVVGTNLAKRFGFEVKPARFYGDSDTRLLIHRQVEGIIAEVFRVR